MNDIYDQILSESLTDHKANKAIRLEQFRKLGQIALKEFDKSKKDVEETQTVKKVCTNCYGETQINGVDCGTCKATGIIETIETIKTKGKTGDPAYLRVFHEVLKEISRIEGLYPRNSYSRKLEFEAEIVGGKIHGKVQELYIEADADLIIKAVATLDELQESLRNGSAKVDSDQKRIESNQD